MNSICIIAFTENKIELHIAHCDVYILFHQKGFCVLTFLYFKYLYWVRGESGVKIYFFPFPSLLSAVLYLETVMSYV